MREKDVGRDRKRERMVTRREGKGSKAFHLKIIRLRKACGLKGYGLQLEVREIRLEIMDLG